MKKKLLVAVIDSGVNKDDQYLEHTDIKNLYYDEQEFKTCYAGKLNPHGTEVIKVLLKEAPDGAELCFNRIYGKSDEQILEVIRQADVFYFGALSNRFIYNNKKFLDKLVTLLLQEKIEIVTVFPIINTYERMKLTDDGGYIKSIYK